MKACETCRALHTIEMADDECAAQLEADVALLNRSAVHIVMARDTAGKQAPITRETIHALASVVRLLHRQTAAGSTWKGGPR